MPNKSSINIIKVLSFLLGVTGVVLLFVHASDGNSSGYGTVSLFKGAVYFFVLSLPSLFYQGWRKLRWGCLDVLLLCFGSVYVLSSIVNGAKVSSVILQEMFPYVLIYISSKVFISAWGKYAETVFFLILCIWLLTESVNGLSQVFGHRPSGHASFGMTGSFSNPGPYGGFISILMSISTVYVLRHFGSWQGLSLSAVQERPVHYISLFVSSVATIAGVLVLPASMSRAAWLGYAISILFYLFSETHLFRHMLHRRLIIFIVILFSAAFCTGVFLLKKDSAIGRFHIWNMEFRAIMDSPFIGTGPGTCLGSYGKAQEEFFSQAERSSSIVNVAGCPEYAFNEYLKSGVEAGFPGLVLGLSIVAVSLIILFRSRSIFGYGLLAAAVFAFFSYPLSVIPLAVICTVLVGVSGATANRDASLVMKVTTAVVAAALSVGVFMFGSIYEHRKEAVDDWASSRYLSSMELYEDSLEELEGLYPELFWNYRYLYDYGYALHKTGAYVRSNEILHEGASISSDPMFHNIMGKNFEALGDYDSAENEYLKSHNMVPCRLYPMVLLMEMYSRTGRETESKEIAEEILRMPLNHRNRMMMELREKAEAELQEK